MTIHKGRINCRQFSTLLHTLLLSEGYEEVSTELTTDGRVYVSSQTNEDKFYLRVLDPVNRYLSIGVYEEYTPSATIGLPGVFGNGILGTTVVWNSSVNSALIDIDYVINITNKYVLIYVEGMRAQSGKMNSISYFGLPKRVSTQDKDGRFAGMTYTANGPYDSHGYFIALRSRNELPIHAYLTDAYIPNRSLGWGGKLFFSPILVGSQAEGTRGELEGIKIIERTDKNAEIAHGDTFTKDGKQYMLVEPTSHGYNTFDTTYDYLIEI